MMQMNEFIQNYPYVLQERLKKLRAEKGGTKKISQEDVGKAIGLNRRSISNYETGKRLPTLSTLVLLAQFYDCWLYYLFGISDEKKSFKYWELQQKNQTE